MSTSRHSRTASARFGILDILKVTCSEVCGTFLSRGRRWCSDSSNLTGRWLRNALMNEFHSWPVNSGQRDDASGQVRSSRPAEEGSRQISPSSTLQRVLPRLFSPSLAMSPCPPALPSKWACPTHPRRPPRPLSSFSSRPSRGPSIANVCASAPPLPLSTTNSV